MTNREWIAAGNTGCTFATLFAKKPSSVGWIFISHVDWMARTEEIDTALLVSIEFPHNWYSQEVKEWCIGNGFTIESTGPLTEGVRLTCQEGTSWVQYFGIDSHVVTRRSPHTMITFTRKLAPKHYAKVGWTGILHLAHAWYGGISERVYDLLWDRSYKQVCKKIGHPPRLEQAAKTTWLKSRFSPTQPNKGDKYRWPSSQF